MSDHGQHLVLRAEAVHPVPVGENVHAGRLPWICQDGQSRDQRDEEPEEIDTRPINTEEYTPHIQEAECSAEDFQYRGVIHWGGYKWTWYSKLILPGEGLKIPVRHVDENGYICYENDYICLASSDLSKGTVVSTPFGKDGKIYDCGCASGTLDVYVHW